MGFGARKPNIKLAIYYCHPGVDIGSLWRENMALLYANNKVVDHPAHQQIILA